MAITTEDIKKLREKTGAGVMDAKRALEEAGGDETKAIAILREKGMAAAAKLTVASVHEVVALGAIDPETVITPGLYVQRVVCVPRPAAARG